MSNDLNKGWRDVEKLTAPRHLTPRERADYDQHMLERIELKKDRLRWAFVGLVYVVVMLVFVWLASHGK